MASYNGVEILPGDSLSDPKFDPRAPGFTGRPTFGTPESIHNTPQPSPEPTPGPTASTPLGLNPQFWENDFRGFVIALRSHFGGSYVYNLGEAQVREMYNAGRRDLAMSPGDLIDPVNQAPAGAFPGTEDDGATGSLPDVGGGPGDGGTSGPPGSGDFFDENVFDYITLLLKRYGLGGLSSWVKNLVVQQATADEITLLLFDKQEFKDRFPAIAMIDNLNQGGVQRGNISPEQYMNLENDYFEFLSRVGLDSAFYNRDRVATWIFQGVSPAEVSRRVTNGYSRLALSSPETLEFFQDTYGIQGLDNLAAFFLDPDNVEDELMRQVEIADIGGRSVLADIGIGEEGATRLAELGVTPQQAGQGFTNINRQRGLFRETVSETEDLTRAVEGFNAQFGLDAGQSDQDLLTRLRTRQSAFQGGGGAFVGTRTTGFGSV